MRQIMKQQFDQKSDTENGIENDFPINESKQLELLDYDSIAQLNSFGIVLVVLIVYLG